MVGLLTFGKRQFEAVDGLMRKTIEPLHDNLQAMLPLVDKDSEAFSEYMVSYFSVYEYCRIAVYYGVVVNPSTICYAANYAYFVP